MRFEWNEANSKANQDKHGVSFDEARSVFFDELARLIDDHEHSAKEDRFVNSRDQLATPGVDCLSLLSKRRCYQDNFREESLPARNVMLPR